METLDVGEAEVSTLPMAYEVKTEVLEDPERIKNVTITLPSGMTAKFIRSRSWTSRP
jgi:hypothetical protein